MGPSFQFGILLFHIYYSHFGAFSPSLYHSNIIEYFSSLYFVIFLNSLFHTIFFIVLWKMELRERNTYSVVHSHFHYFSRRICCALYPRYRLCIKLYGDHSNGVINRGDVWQWLAGWLARTVLPLRLLVAVHINDKIVCSWSVCVSSIHICVIIMRVDIYSVRKYDSKKKKHTHTHTMKTTWLYCAMCGWDICK